MNAEANHRREFVAYDATGIVIASRAARDAEPLEFFAAEHPDSDVAEVRANREARFIAKAGAAS